MVRVASCPQCEHDLLVPDDAVPSALVKCPQCRAFFELQHAESRDLPTALVVDSHPPQSVVDNTKTVTDFSSRATLKADLEPISEEELRVETDMSDTIDLGDENDFLVENAEADQGFAQPPGPRIADTHEFKPPGSETHEEAAQRIDEWFRSAKTLSDVPALEPSDFADTAPGDPSQEMLEPTGRAAGSETIDISSEPLVFADDAADFELEAPSDSPNNQAPWDDSQHMDRLLADIEGQPADTYEPVADEVSFDDEASLAEEESLEESLDEEEPEQFQPASDWTPDESLAIPSAAAPPERKRSIVRTLLVSTVGGILGLGLGYYALLWLGPMLGRGREIDFLEVAVLLPKAMLPSAFQDKELKRLPPSQPDQVAADPPESDKVVQSDPAPMKDAEPAKDPEPVAPAPAAPPADTTVKTPDAPAEKQAAFTTPVEPPKKAVDPDDRYAVPTAKSEPAMREPAPLDAPPAKSITESAPKAEPVRIKNAPSFPADAIAASLAAASAAEAGLVTGNLQDNKEVAHKKGISYVAIADLAQKATFADAPGDEKSQQQVDDFFRKLLSDAHARDEVAQIAPRWMNHAKRPQNGVFLAGNVKHLDVLGSVIEYTVELNGGASVVVVSPVTDRDASISGPKGPIAVYGSIVEKPADDIPGYTGKSPKVVFAKKLLPLE